MISTHGRASYLHSQCRVFGCQTVHWVVLTLVLTAVIVCYQCLANKVKGRENTKIYVKTLLRRERTPQGSRENPTLKQYTKTLNELQFFSLVYHRYSISCLFKERTSLPFYRLRREKKSTYYRCKKSLD
jgi:hypothetical protein